MPLCIQLSLHFSMISSSYRGGSEEHITGIMIEVILINNVCAVYKYKYIALCVAPHSEVFQNFTGVRLSLSWQYVSLLRPPLVHRSMCGVLCGTGQQQHTYM